ncbi:MAG TPA: bifunctional oligoribonuclease/PAP phosphatase NrnA [Thermodesulfobacteriota bacterium]|nr:bifunctional oligoribonuclease/PAP phosphatase NrnA [Thermodesulfobacteriota bacterium]
MIDRIIAELKNNNTFLIVSHINPDGDAIGSELALAAGLTAIGKKVTVFNQDRVPDIVSFLPGASEIVHELSGGEQFDAAIVVDCGTPKQLGDNFNSFKGYKKLLNIDHHVTNLNFADIVLVDPDACATGVIIYRILKKMGIEITREIALSIYTTIVVDTGSFHYGNSNPEAFKVAGEMVDIGVEPWYVAENLYESQPEGRIRLHSMALNTLSTNYNGKIGFIMVSNEMYKSTGTTAEDTDGIVNYARSLKGVEVAIFIREISRDKYKASLRSKGRVDVTRVAERFDGGGHVNAAGCVLNESLSEVKRKLTEATEEVLKSGQ